MSGARAIRILVHAALLVLPLAPLTAVGRSIELARPSPIACVLGLLALAEVEASSRTTPDPSRLGAPGTGLALTSALGLLVTAWAAIGFPSDAPRAWVSLLGALLFIAGTGLRAAAIRALGAAFTSEIVAPHALVRSGIYARMRHPSDVGLLLLALGLTCLAGSLPAALLASLLILPSVALRIHREDRALALRHPAAHAAYRARVSLTGWQLLRSPAPTLPTR